MIAECWTIVALLLMMSFMLFVRKGTREVALSLLPLIVVPVFHIMAGPVVRFLIAQVEFPFHFLVIAMDGLGLVIACIAIGVVGTFIKSKKLRWLYLVTCGGFSVILDWVLLYNTVGRFL